MRDIDCSFITGSMQCVGGEREKRNIEKERDAQQ